MKVALISFYFLETSIPLAKNLSMNGVEVDLFCIMSQGNQNSFVFDLTENKQPNGFINPAVINSTMSEKLRKYLSGINTKFFIYPNRRLQKYLLGDLYYAYKLVRHIKKTDYDIVHIIQAPGSFCYLIYFLLKKKKIIVTLHEVTSHEANTSSLELRKMKWLIKNSIPVIFHSNTSKNRYIDYSKTVTSKKIATENLKMIRFGLFDTYHCFSSQSITFHQKEKINILNFGRIVPYKGIHILIEAVKLLQDKYPIQLIVAGSGTPYFNFKGIKDYQFINRSLTNEEIVKLIEESDMVVLPYTSASQSGIPMTVYSFNKPIVASNIDGLSEVIDHLKTGILVDQLSGQSFADSIEQLILDKELKNKMKENIADKYTDGEYSWTSIANRTINFYQQQLNPQFIPKR